MQLTKNIKFSKNSTRAWLIAIALVAFAIRFYKIGQQSYWLDEMVSLDIADSGTWKSFFIDTHPPLYHLLLRLWIYLWGHNEVATRALSAVLSVGSIVGLFVVGRRLRSTSAGFLAAIFLALHPMSVLYAQETRMYSLFELLTVLAFLFWQEALDLGKSRRPWVLVCIGLAITHFFSIFLIFFQTVYFIKRSPASRKGRFSLLLMGVLPVVSFAGMWWLGYKNLFPLEWQQLRYEMIPSSDEILRVLRGICGSWVTGGIFAATATALLFSSHQDSKKPKWSLKFFLILLFSSVGSVWLMAELLHRSLLISRYFIFLVPLFNLNLALALAALFQNGRWWRGLALLLTLTVIFSQGFALKETYKIGKAPWREAAQLIAQSELPVVFTTRPLGLRTPYFSDRNIDVLRWGTDHFGNANEPPGHGMGEVRGITSSGRHVWFIENYWGQLLYWDQLKAELAFNGLQIRSEIFSQVPDDPIFVIETWKPAAAATPAPH